jgi:hypothetical protein
MPHYEKQTRRGRASLAGKRILAPPGQVRGGTARRAGVRDLLEASGDLVQRDLDLAVGRADGAQKPRRHGDLATCALLRLPGGMRLDPRPPAKLVAIGTRHDSTLALRRAISR